MYYSAGPFMRPPAHKTTPKKGKSGLVGWSETGHPIDYSFIRPLHQVVFLAYGENVVVPFPSIVSSLGKVMLNLRARHHVSHAALNYLSKEFHTTFNQLNINSHDNPFDLDSILTLSSQKARSKFFKTSFNLVFPTEHIVGRKQVRRRKKGISIPVFIPTTFFISLFSLPSLYFDCIVF